MLDIQTASADAAAAATPIVIHREDYCAPDWLVPNIDLDFALDADRTVVSARLSVALSGAHDRPLVLDGEGLELLSVKVDGAALPRDQWPQGDAPLTISLSATTHIIFQH